MWIIKHEKGYVKSVDHDKAPIAENVIFTDDRDIAKQFTKQEAKDFQVEFSITGSIIPA